MTNREAMEFASKNSFQALYAKGVAEGYNAGLKDGYDKAIADYEYAFKIGIDEISEAYQQARTDAIDECIKIVNKAYYDNDSLKMIVKYFEQLKEQNE